MKEIMEDLVAGSNSAAEAGSASVQVRTRFAPSPTGRMHIGNLRSALYEFLIAKHAGGDFLLRIEDTDQERYVEGAVDLIYRTLDKTGLRYDEGPGREKGCGPYVQSERVKTGVYMRYALELVEKGEAYYCFCDRERLASLETITESGARIATYDKHCLNLSPEEVKANLAQGKPYVIRQNIPREGVTTFHDELYGNITVENRDLDDMVLIKSDGYPTYNFANVVDDHLMGITHVVRGNEYLSSAPKYARLYQAFGWQNPVYIHLPLITDENHKKLSKRSGHSSFEDLTDAGFLPEAIVNFVALLGWCPEENREFFTLQELIETFDYRRIGKAPAVFDVEKLRWMNGEYIKRMEFDAYYALAEPYIRRVITRAYDLRKIAALVKTRIETFADIPEKIDFFERMPEYDTELYCNKKSKTDRGSSLQTLTEVLPLLEREEDYSNDHLYAVLTEYAAKRGVKIGAVVWPLRIAVAGRAVTPGGVTEILEVLGREESLARLRAGIALLARVCAAE